MIVIFCMAPTLQWFFIIWFSAYFVIEKKTKTICFSRSLLNVTMIPATTYILGRKIRPEEKIRILATIQFYKSIASVRLTIHQKNKYNQHSSEGEGKKNSCVTSDHVVKLDGR